MVFMLRTMAVASISAIAQSLAFRLFSAYLQAFGLPEPMNTLEVDSPALLPQQHRDPTATISVPATCQPVHIDNQAFFFLADVVPVTLRRTSLAKGSANPSL